MPDKRIVNVVFGSSGAGSLREALAEANCLEQVVSSDDVFCFGPIDSASDAGIRAQWMNQQLGIDDWELVVAQNAHVLASSIATDVHPVVWFSRRDAQSYAGLLWWLSHLGDGPCGIVDVTETLVPGLIMGNELRPPRLAISPSLLPQAEMIGVRETARSLQGPEQQAYLQLWQKLVQENAPLRAIDEANLVSAPITYFDPLLLSCMADQWRKMARVIGEALARQMDEEVLQLGDAFLHARLRALIDAGAIEAKGDPRRMQYCEVRQWGRRKD